MCVLNDSKFSFPVFLSWGNAGISSMQFQCWCKSPCVLVVLWPGCSQITDQFLSAISYHPEMGLCIQQCMFWLRSLMERRQQLYKTWIRRDYRVMGQTRLNMTILDGVSWSAWERGAAGHNSDSNSKALWQYLACSALRLLVHTCS